MGRRPLSPSEPPNAIAPLATLNPPLLEGSCMFRKVMVANRGEIALRVLNACREFGIRTVAVYSEADRNSLHVRFADEAICIGPPRAADSYLNVPAVISAAEIANVDAIHPGYGLLSENANFAEVCRASNIKFIGPPPEVTRLMGEKEKARQAMKEANVPILPGSDGVIADADEALLIAKKIGYPVILKAKAGGGGRGMRIVRTNEELPNLFHAAHTEAANAFGNGELYMEKFIEQPRHIEFQILADEHGNVASLFERECSIQRRHQKLIEEAPSLQVTPAMRDEIGQTLVRCLKHIGYQNAGTIEFLMDEDGKLYFIEMNTRIQVEHPVTEFITGIDLVKAQLRIAAGEKLSDILPPRLEIRGHAIECRINAEHPKKFTPSAGKITAFNVPGGNGVRVDTAQYAEGIVPPYYDSLIAKLVCYGVDREEAIARTERALSQFIVQGIETSIPLHQGIFRDEEFRAGKFDTKFMERFLARPTD
jgi:acetyl-CoA carboxylase biotin carboxylase subunit